MLDILKPIEIRSGSYQPLKIKVYDNNNQRVEDITEYELKLLIIKDEYSTSPLVTINGVKTGGNFFQVDIFSQYTKELNGQYYYMIAIKCPNNEVIKNMGYMNIDWGVDVSWN